MTEPMGLTTFEVWTVQQLRDAIGQATSGDTIVLRGDGPFLLDGTLTVKAGVTFRLMTEPMGERGRQGAAPLGTAVALHEIREQRRKGWPDFHPETYCHRCGRLNVRSWFVDHALWAEAFPKDSVQVVDQQSYSTAEKAFNGIICPPCFTELHAAATGDWHTWELRIET